MKDKKDNAITINNSNVKKNKMKDFEIDLTEMKEKELEPMESPAWAFGKYVFISS